MRLLLDACVAGCVAPLLESAGHEVERVSDWENDPGDDAILSRAHSTGQILVTLDKDFGELAIVRQHPHCGIVRLVCLASNEQGPALVAAIERHRDDLDSGAIVTVERSRVRVRSAS